MPLFKKNSWLLLLICLVLSVNGQMISDYEERKGPLSALREKYDELPSSAKVATAGAAGFITSRVALKTFVSAAKVAGAAFIA